MYAYGDDGMLHRVECSRVPDDATVHVAAPGEPNRECSCWTVKCPPP